MWSLFFVALASVCSTGSSIAMRKTLDYKGGVGGYLTFYFFISCIASLFLNSIFTFEHAFSFRILALGGLTGILVIALMLFMGRAFQTGPSGLTMAFLNAGSVVPSLLMPLIFANSFGFSLSFGNIFGMCLVIGGLFWAAFWKKEASFSYRWFIFALLTFLAQAVILTIFQWQNLLTIDGLPSHPCLPFHCQEEEMLWFTPAMFFSAWIVHMGFFYFKERRLPKKAELIGGGSGGMANGLATFFLLSGVQSSTTPMEKAMLFPLFAVAVIFLCNLYGRSIYKERVNWMANGCCALGILVGTLF